MSVCHLALILRSIYSSSPRLHLLPTSYLFLSPQSSTEGLCRAVSLSREYFVPTVVESSSEGRLTCCEKRRTDLYSWDSLGDSPPSTNMEIPDDVLRQQDGVGSRLAKQMLSGGLAGMLADGIMYPMMTVKSRLQVQGAAAGTSSGGTGAVYMYRGPMHAIYTISVREGWRTFYKGYATVTQIAPAQALYMASYQSSKKLLPGGENNPVVHFCGGVLATLVQSSVTVPVEVIRQRQMVQTSGAGSYQGSLHAATSIYQAEGFRALYRGFGLAQMVWGPYNSIYLPLWEATKRAAVRYSGAESVQKLDVHWELLSSLFSASCAAAATNPMDVIKTRLQVQGKSNVSNSTQYTGAIDAAKTIWQKEGFKGFFGGVTSRIFWIAPSSMIMFTCYDQLMKRL